VIASLDRRRVPAPPRFPDAGGEPPGPQVDRPAATAVPMEEIIAEARAGNEKAWICLYRCLAPQVRGYFEARRMRQRDGPAFRTWVFTIAHSRLVDDIRRSQRRGEDAPLEQAAWVAAADDVEGEVMAHLRREELVGLLDDLSADQRDVVLLRVLGGLSVAEVAAVLHRTVTGVKVLHHRAVKAVQKRLEANDVTKPGPRTVT
jgi:RNA polymerase sigma-70 factor (ECF subfamily)